MRISKIVYSIICIILVSAFIMLMLSAFNTLSISSVSNQVVRTLPTIIIDAGHGGEDGGAVSAEGVLEKDINLEIANITTDFFKFMGFKIKQTRSTDIMLDNGEDTIRARKVSDMKKRLEIFSSDAENIVLSIHQNKFTESQYYGTQVFYSPNHKNSIALAESIKYSVTTLLQPENKRECKKADSNIYLLKKTTNPAVIVECGFISNPDECAKLLTEEYRQQMSYSITMGFLNFYNANY